MITIRDEMSISQSDIDATIEYLHNRNKNPTDLQTILYDDIFALRIRSNEHYSDIVVRLWGFDSFTVTSTSPSVSGISYNSGIVHEHDNKYRKDSRPSGIDMILHKLRSELGPYCDINSRNVIVFKHSTSVNMVEREMLLELLTNSGCVISQQRYINRNNDLIPQWSGVIIRCGRLIIPSIIETSIEFTINFDFGRAVHAPFRVNLEDPEYYSTINSFLG